MIWTETDRSIFLTIKNTETDRVSTYLRLDQTGSRDIGIWIVSIHKYIYIYSVKITTEKAFSVQRIVIENGIKHGIYNHKAYINTANKEYRAFVFVYFSILVILIVFYNFFCGIVKIVLK